MVEQIWRSDRQLHDYTSVRDVDSWTTTNELDVTQCDENGHVSQSAADIYAADSDDEADDLWSESDDEASDFSRDSDDFVEVEPNELKMIRREYSSLPAAANAPVVGCNRKKVPRNIFHMKPKLTTGDVNSGVGSRRLQITETDKISRTKCVLCNRNTTIGLMEVTETVAIPCCLPCILAVNELGDVDNTRKLLVARIEAGHELPIFFNAPYNYRRVFLEKLPPNVNAKDMAHGTYNRRHPS